MKLSSLLKIAWQIVILDEKSIKEARAKITNVDRIWFILLMAGISAFIGQFWVTRSYHFAPDLIWLAYHGISIIVLLFFFILFSYLLAFNALGKHIHWNDFFVPAGLGAIITWISIIPYFVIVGLWYVVVLFTVVKTLFACTIEKAALVILGSIALSLIAYNILNMLFQWPSLHWFM